MSSKISVTKKQVFSKLTPTPEEAAARVTYSEQGDLSKPEMVNHVIEAEAHRQGIPSGEGDICIDIQAGDELGDISFNVQFEGKKGDYAFCVQEQNELLLSVSEWVQALLSELDADFEVELESRPCPTTDRHVWVDLAAAVLEQRQTRPEALEVLKARQAEETGHSEQVLGKSVVIVKTQPNNSVQVK